MVIMIIIQRFIVRAPSAITYRPPVHYNVIHELSYN